MSFELAASPLDCCRPCPEPLVQNIPGAQGAAGADGTNGTNGVNAFTTVTAPFAMPAELAGVLVEFADATWAALGQIIFLGDPAAAAHGYFEVAGIVDGTHLTITNLADTPNGAYTSNSAPGTAFVAGTAASPGGLQGPQGAAGTGSAPTDATYITQTPNAALTNEQAMSGLATGLVKNTTATGVQSIVPIGVADANVAPVDAAAGLMSGDAVFGTASGVETKDAASARTALGLGTMATQDANNVAITGGTISGVTLPAPSGVPKDYLLFQNRRATTVDGGVINSGGWVTVPLNTKVADTGSNGSIASSEITLTAGTYRAVWTVPMFRVNAVATRLYQVSAPAGVVAAGGFEAYGSNAYASDQALMSGDTSFGDFRFTVAAAAVIRLEVQVETTNGTDGFGAANNFGGPEIYQSLELVKESA